MGLSPEQKKKFEKNLQATKQGLEEGKKMTTIAKELGVTAIMVRRYKKRLKELGMLNILTSEEKLNITERMIKEGKTLVEIARKLRTTRQTVSKYRDELIEQGKLTGEEKSKKPRTIEMEKRLKKEKEILDEKKRTGEELTRKQMSKETNVSKVTISRDKVRLRRQREKELFEWNEKIIKLYDSFEGQPKSIEKFEGYLALCKEEYEERMIKEENLIPIKYAVMATERYSNVAFYIKLCIRFNMFEEALQFIRIHVNRDGFSQEEKEKIEKSRIECQRFCQAAEMIRKNREAGKSNEDEEFDKKIMEVTGLSKVEVAVLKKKVSKEENKIIAIRNQEENDDADEQGIEIS